MWKKVTVGTLVGVLVLGMLMVPASASHLDTEAGLHDGVAGSGSSWTGCADDGSTYVSKSWWEDDVEYPNHWSYFSMRAPGFSLWDGAVGDMKLCAQLDVVPAVWNGNLFSNNPGYGCVISDGKGSINYDYGDTGREMLWLRNVRSHGDVVGAVQPLMGEVVAAPDAATAATMTAHHYIYIELRTSSLAAPCFGSSDRAMAATYRIVSQNQSELPLLCEDGWENGCLYGPGPSEWPPL